MLTTSAVTFTRVPAITYFESHLSSLNMILRRSAVIKVHLTLRRTFNLIFFEIVPLKHSTFVRTNETRFIKDNFRRSPLRTGPFPLSFKQQNAHIRLMQGRDRQVIKRSLSPIS
ncbi:MAG: hypothetical protein ACTS6G_04360 [Candidatus Hodgkinia cicadicola]